mmetsp:Transcript_33482/g.78281  ORF Transcript_33482/g.78281 Transcript_33482/m.78281 type:complete len:138 (-) Transcript_33482:2249-2662(-)
MLALPQEMNVARHSTGTSRLYYMAKCKRPQPLHCSVQSSPAGFSRHFCCTKFPQTMLQLSARRAGICTAATVQTPNLAAWWVCCQLLLAFLRLPSSLRVTEPVSWDAQIIMSPKRVVDPAWDQLQERRSLWLLCRRY